VSAVATTFAAVTALSLPFVLSSLERRRRDRTQFLLIEAAYETISSIISYYRVSDQLTKMPWIYLPQFQSLDRIAINTTSQLRTLELIVKQNALPIDILALVSISERIGGVVQSTVGHLQGADGGTVERTRSALTQIEQLASLGEERLEAVKKTYRIADASAGVAIKAKYGDVAAACVHAHEHQSAPVVNDLTATPW
jgi:hypothetical protein